jgi:hypothetical protein
MIHERMLVCSPGRKSADAPCPTAQRWEDWKAEKAEEEKKRDWGLT